MSRLIPTNLILGFLGSGKTTAISNLLEHKPQHETWAVLVNGFCGVGIDGQLLSDRAWPPPSDTGTPAVRILSGPAADRGLLCNG